LRYIAELIKSLDTPDKRAALSQDLLRFLQELPNTAFNLACAVVEAERLNTFTATHKFLIEQMRAVADDYAASALSEWLADSMDRSGLTDE